MADKINRDITCVICASKADRFRREDFGAARGNTERFKKQSFQLWKCPHCRTIQNVEPVDFEDIYSDYPLNKRRLDVFASGTMTNLLNRLEREGLQKKHSILDFGCGNGVFLDFLRLQGYTRLKGYDPYVPSYSERPAARFDCVIANDVLEHCDNPRALIQTCLNHLKPGGLLYIGTADSNGVSMNDLTPHLMRLHQPFHRIILSEETFLRLTSEFGLARVRSYTRSYMDTRMPFANYRFLDEVSKACGHNLDEMFGPRVALAFLKNPFLWFFGLFGSFFPSAYEPAVILRNTKESSHVPSHQKRHAPIRTKANL